MSGAPLSHEPLPYVVTVRVALDDDHAPELRQIKLVAYSVIEAMVQASIIAGGSIGHEDARVKVERIDADVEAYHAQIGGIA